MTLSEFLNDDEDLYISCPTYEEALALCMAFHKHGKRWRSGSSYIGSTSFYVYTNEMIYSNKGSYADTSYAIPRSHKILKLNMIAEYNSEILENINLIKKIEYSLESYEEFGIPIEKLIVDYAKRGIDIGMDLVITIKEKR